MSLFERAGKRLTPNTDVEMSLEEYLEKAKTDKMMYATAAERLLHAIGDPSKVDTREHPRLGRIFSNRTISVYSAFEEIYGLENPLQSLVSFLQHSAQGLEESKQIMYLLGPVGAAKSTIVKILKRLFEQVPFYAIKGSPVHDSPLSLFTKEDARELGIPERYFRFPPSPVLTKRVQQMNGDLSQIRVVRLFPSEIQQIAISHIEPGDENNQDISALVGKINIREMSRKDTNDPDAYSYTGGLCLGNRGLVEFAEMFKAPIKSLNPLLEATQSGFYKGTESIAAIPFDGIVIAHSNESEWQKFRNNPTNEAFIDRVYLIRIPYCLRYAEEQKIYEKMLGDSSLSDSPIAPKTLEILAQFSILSRLIRTTHSNQEIKLEVYNGENLKHKNNSAKSVSEYEKEAHESGQDEGFFGLSTRFAFKALAATFNYDAEEVAANPVHLLNVLAERVKAEHFDQETEKKYIHFLQHLHQEYLKYFDGDIKTAVVENSDGRGQAMFDKYIRLVGYVLDEEDYRSPETGLLETPKDMEKFLEEIEGPAHIGNKKDFRQEVRSFCLKHQAKNNGRNPDWKSYIKMKEVIEANMFNNLENILPIICKNTQATEDEQKDHTSFVKRMSKMGYTPRQVEILVDWYIKANKS